MSTNCMKQAYDTSQQKDPPKAINPKNFHSAPLFPAKNGQNALICPYLPRKPPAYPFAKHKRGS